MTGFQIAAVGVVTLSLALLTIFHYRAALIDAQSALAACVQLKDDINEVDALDDTGLTDELLR